MNIHIVSHCWAEKNKQFADALYYQLSSLAIHRPQCRAYVTVVCTKSDESVANVVNAFQDLVEVQQCFLSLENVGRRSIGRNYVAKCLSVDADIVWFADVDYFFGEGCLDALSGHTWPEEWVAVFPKTVLISSAHAMGDKALSLARCAQQQPSTIPIDVVPADYVLKRYNQAIGGAQIVRGDIAQLGYLPGQLKWQQPTASPFHDTREDVQYRKQLREYGEIVGIDLPNVFRLRHTEGHPA